MEITEVFSILNIIEGYIDDNNGQFIACGDDYMLDVLTVLIKSNKYDFNLSQKNGEYPFEIIRR